LKPRLVLTQALDGNKECLRAPTERWPNKKVNPSEEAMNVRSIACPPLVAAFDGNGGCLGPWFKYTGQ